MAVDIGGFDISGVATKALDTGGTIIIFIIALLAAFVVFLLIKKQMKYDVPVEIIEIDNSGVVYKKDKAGIFFDSKTKNRLFWLKKHKVGLRPDQVPYVRTIGQTPIWKFWMQPRKVYLYQYGYKNFSYISPTISNPNIDFGVGDSDVSWGLNAYEAGKTLRLSAWYTQIMPYIPYIILSVTMLIIVIYLFKSFPEIKELIAAAGDTAMKLGEASAKMTNSGAIIVGGG